MNKQLTALNQPLRLGRVTAKNRIWEAPMWTRTASVNGEVTDRTIAHYEARAKGGAGVITVEATAIDPNHTWNKPELRIDDDKFGPGLRRLVEAVHIHDALIIIQLHHAGMFGNNPVSPSGVACQDLGKIGEYIQPEVLTVKEIEKIRDNFIAGAERAMKIGFDGVEIHGATAYLLQQFFSPHNNKRVDKYGGSLHGRIQLPLEIVRGIREKCGHDFILGYTVAEADLLPDGITREDTLAFAKALEQAGITYFDLQSDGTYETLHSNKSRGGYRRQVKGQFDKSVVYKETLNIPVTTRASGQYNPIVWNEAIEKGMVDAVRLGKQIIADADVACKALEGNIEDIRPCIKCGNCIVSGQITDWELSCTVNPNVGKIERPFIPAYISKKVLVIGGGPGGLEAARIAALRGHSVTLVEKKSHLGGNLYIGSLPIGKEDLVLFIDWAENQCKNLGVNINLNTEASVEMVQELKPDVVIVATGSSPRTPDIPGINKSHVVTAEDVLLEKANIGKKVIVVGSGEVALETADFIMEKNMVQELTILSRRTEVGVNMAPIDKAVLFANDDIYPKHFKNGLKIATETRIQEVTDKGVIVTDKYCNRYEIEADTVISALGYAPNNKLYESLKEKTHEIYCIGDARSARRAWEAIHEADYFARQI